MVVAALSTAKFADYIHAEPAGNKIVLVGDREEAQRIAVEAGAKVVITTNGVLPSREIKELAEAKGVSLLSSPYDTSSTSLLVLYSAPVITVADETIVALSPRDWIKTAKQAIAASPSRSVPVVDDEGRVYRSFFRRRSHKRSQYRCNNGGSQRIFPGGGRHRPLQDSGG
jgi:manganese-dependent inorganic pyrophosphatase